MEQVDQMKGDVGMHNVRTRSDDSVTPPYIFQVQWLCMIVYHLAMENVAPMIFHIAHPYIILHNLILMNVRYTYTYTCTCIYIVGKSLSESPVLMLLHLQYINNEGTKAHNPC